MLTLQGTEDNSGIYTCRLYNSIGESRKNFNVTFDEGLTFTTTLIAVVVVLLVALVAGLGMGIKLYLDKVRRTRF